MSPRETKSHETKNHRRVETPIRPVTKPLARGVATATGTQREAAKAFYVLERTAGAQMVAA